MTRALAADRSCRLLDAVADLVRGDAFDIRRLHDAATFVAEDLDGFHSWLSGLRDQPGMVREIARRSYWHPNGFAKLVLHVSDDPEFRVRLHVWPDGPAETRLGESNPHSHRWDFASTVVAGDGLETEEFVEVDDGMPYDRYRYGADPSNKAALVPCGPAGLVRTAEPTIWYGQVYDCDTSVVHTVRPIGSTLVATVVVQGRRKTDSTVVYCEPGTDADQPNVPLSETDFLEITGAVLAGVRHWKGARP